jgi:serine protease Do
MEKRFMLSTKMISKWFVAAAVPAVVAVYYSFALPGASQAGPKTADTISQEHAADGPLVTGLPDFTRLVERYGPSVVNVAVSGSSETAARANPAPNLPENNPFEEFFRRFGPPVPPQGEAPIQRGQGSGFIISSDGLIMTNAHVVGTASEITVKLMDRREFDATVVGIDEQTDVAVLRIDAKNLPAVKIGDAKDLKVGEWVIAIGSPFGFENTVTSGIVSGKSRSLPDGTYVPFIQTDVAVNPGNSGGPLFNMSGEVVGVNSQIFSRTGGYMGLSFAIPIDAAMNVKDQLVAHGTVTRGRIGVHIQAINQTLAHSFGMSEPSGALVSEVEPGGPAEKAGIRSGDVILSVDGEPISQMTELPAVIGFKKPGSKVKIDVWRDRQEKQIDVVVGSFEQDKVAVAQQPAKVETSKLGLAVRQLTPEEEQQLNGEQGLFVERAEGPAAAAGLRRGDVILAVGSTPVSSVEQLLELSEQAGNSVALLVQRNNQRTYVPLQTG